jgi:hypothetical protein
MWAALQATLRCGAWVIKCTAARGRALQSARLVCAAALCCGVVGRRSSLIPLPRIGNSYDVHDCVEAEDATALFPPQTSRAPCPFPPAVLRAVQCSCGRPRLTLTHPCCAQCGRLCQTPAPSAGSSQARWCSTWWSAAAAPCSPPTCRSASWTSPAAAGCRTPWAGRQPPRCAPARTPLQRLLASCCTLAHPSRLACRPTWAVCLSGCQQPLAASGKDCVRRWPQVIVALDLGMWTIRVTAGPPAAPWAARAAAPCTRHPAAGGDAKRARRWSSSWRRWRSGRPRCRRRWRAAWGSCAACWPSSADCRRRVRPRHAALLAPGAAVAIACRQAPSRRAIPAATQLPGMLAAHAHALAAQAAACAAADCDGGPGSCQPLITIHMLALQGTGASCRLLPVISIMQRGHSTRWPSMPTCDAGKRCTGCGAVQPPCTAVAIAAAMCSRISARQQEANALRQCNASAHTSPYQPTRPAYPA